MKSARLPVIFAITFATWSDCVLMAEDEEALLESESSNANRSGLSLETIAEFRRLDLDGGGDLDPAEFQRSKIVSMATTGGNPAESAALFASMDSDDSGGIGLFEFAQSQHNRNAGILTGVAARDYHEIDTDLDG